MAVTSSFHRRRWLGGHRRGNAEARARGNITRFAASGIACAFDTARPATITLNGNNASAFASYVGAVTLGQGTGAAQPLAVGTTKYGEFPSLQFTAASSQNMGSVSTNLIAGNPCTFVSVQRARAAPVGAGFFFTNSDGANGLVLSLQTTSRNFVANGVANRTDASFSTTLPEVWVGRDYGTGSPVATLWVNGAPVAITNNSAARSAATAGSAVEFGGSALAASFADVDMCFGAIFTTAVDDGIVTRISKALAARAGVVA